MSFYKPGVTDVVEMPYPYRAILGRGTINKFEAIVHQLYLCMKIPAPTGVITVRDAITPASTSLLHSSSPLSGSSTTRTRWPV